MLSRAQFHYSRTELHGGQSRELVAGGDVGLGGRIWRCGVSAVGVGRAPAGLGLRRSPPIVAQTVGPVRRPCRCSTRRPCRACSVGADNKGPPRWGPFVVPLGGGKGGKGVVACQHRIAALWATDCQPDHKRGNHCLRRLALLAAQVRAVVRPRFHRPRQCGPIQWPETGSACG